MNYFFGALQFQSISGVQKVCFCTCCEAASKELSREQNTRYFPEESAAPPHAKTHFLHSCSQFSSPEPA
jgi:hypothetical protein